ncbi:hypothetical protein PXD56_09105 [Maribacter sp. SA7]|uniref:hypothetical protein n=1 Tax=Maribacter zhoushanensis TaxID=3030012 RepID=UPI0023ED4A90|nr:hypothetical protein [Maribacter zhoushanensis]MDF4203112.1 hypothetical protein [Maribacter zhoushanensis]
MKTIATIIFIIFLSFNAQAQNNDTTVEIETVETTIVTEAVDQLNAAKETEVARLYKFKNSRIKKDLNFITKANKPKMA